VPSQKKSLIGYFGFFSRRNELSFLGSFLEMSSYCGVLSQVSRLACHHKASVLQCVVAVCYCSVLLQCVVAVCCCSVLLQCVAVCCNKSRDLLAITKKSHLLKRNEFYPCVLANFAKTDKIVCQCQKCRAPCNVPYCFFFGLMSHIAYG